MAGVATREAVCDARADYSLRVEDYPEAVKLHRRVVAAHPEDALAHYHLGFAYGMLGGHGEELAEYRRAASLGLKQWDLFLNLGLAYLEEGKLQGATEALTTAISLGPNHPEGHFNLGLTYERRGMLARARQEMLSSLRLDPKQRDARNMLGVIDAEDGDYTNARLIWFELARTEPDFAPARANLAILDRIENSASTPRRFEHGDVNAPATRIVTRRVSAATLTVHVSPTFPGGRYLYQ
jgi:Flp pilus assembly protein TadD